MAAELGVEGVVDDAEAPASENPHDLEATEPVAGAEERRPFGRAHDLAEEVVERVLRARFEGAPSVSHDARP
jgi:hypothetical protein